MLASKWFDMVVGVDTHIIMVPSPAGPIPTPLPNPFIGMVYDPAGMVFSIGFGAVTGGVSFTLVNGLPVTNTGTGATNKMTMPHIPVPGPFMIPPGDSADLLFGGLEVHFAGSHVVRLGDLAFSCNDPVELPVSQVIVIPTGPPVLVNRPPSPDVMGMVFLAGGKLTSALLERAGKLGKKLFAAFRKMQKESKFFEELSEKLAVKAEGKLSRARSAWNRAVCFLTGHPVDVATGRMVTDHLDVELPGALPLRFQRFYDSSLAWRESPVGFGWSHSLDQAVWAERGRVVYRTEDGREVEFSTLDLPDRVLSPGQALYHKMERLTLRCLGPWRYEVEDALGLVREFAAVPGRAADTRVAVITRKRTRAGHALAYTYDRRGLLADVADDAGRRLVLQHDPRGRLIRIDAVGADGATTTPARFGYDAAGDLTEALDAAEAAYHYEYVTHLMVKETNRLGLSFYFQYDGMGSAARCIRTWGDDGLYDHVITYDTANRRTLVENSLGRVTLYQMDEANQVVSIVDALGGETKYAYDEKTGQKIAETDTGGGETSYTYDARGNCTRLVAPDGGMIEVEFDDRNLPVFARDAVKGEWSWGHDHRGHLIGRIDPLGRRTQFQWDGGRLVGLTDPAGQHTHLGYDRDGNVNLMRTPDGAESRWSYDGFGRVMAAIDAKGNVQRREHDRLGRVTRVREADGNDRELEYDAEGNIVHARDKQHDVRFGYRGMGRLISRTEAGTTVAFEYDTEEQLVAIRNQQGHVHKFQLGPTGLVNVEHGFDGIRRQYLRDPAGRVTKVLRPAGLTTEYAYDSASRITSVKHADGTSQGFAYRIDGALMEARNDAGTVAFERDLLGHVVKESCGDDWVATEYDSLGMRVRVRSSKGLDQRIQRNALGDVLAVRAGTGQLGAGATDAWEARFQRDVLGLEVARSLPGGVESKWERDRQGRPIKHELWSGGTFRGAWQYSWEPNDRLRLVIDALRGPVQYQHDALGNLAAAVYEDGRVDLRMPDAVGNLFRTEARADRNYGPAGQLLESREPDGGVVTYSYDGEGNLIRKVQRPANGGPERVWTYAWNGGGMLARVVRPDGAEVTFTYDALGRRLTKTFRGKTTRWIWDGNVPLHEWVERDDAALDKTPPVEDPILDELAARRRRAEQVAHAQQGPPPEEGTAASPITWLFEPDTFAPVARLAGESKYAIITDHLGTPRAMLDTQGVPVWSASLDAYGDLRHVEGARSACPFRWPGQYEDEETGLYYNRFRYYDPGAGQYLTHDPLSVRGGLNVRAYVADPLRLRDPLGLSCKLTPSHEALFEHGATAFVPESVWKDIKGNSHFGRADGLYVTTKAEGDAIVATGSRDALKERMGIPPDKWNEPIMRVDIPDPMANNARMPAGTEAAANSLFKPGGFTSGGAPEAVLDPVPMSQVVATGPFF
jgi:RHS repeat-associated protein